MTERVEYSEEYKSGYQAYERGEEKRTCPYMKNSSSHAKWVRGWEDAKDDNEQEYYSRG